MAYPPGPPPGGAPPPGYPPPPYGQQQPYPQQQQQQGYPPQPGYPPQGYAQPYPQQGYAPPGYPPQGYAPPPGYGPMYPPPGYAPMAMRRMHPKAQTALILGGVAWVLSLWLVCSIPAWVLGAQARSEIRANPHLYTGETEATIGMWLGIVHTVLPAVVILIVLMALAGTAHW